MPQNLFCKEKSTYKQCSYLETPVYEEPNPQSSKKKKSLMLIWGTAPINAWIKW